MFKLTPSIFLLTFVVYASFSQSDTSSSPPSRNNSELFPIKQRLIEWMLTDQKFVDKGIEASRAEVELAELAAEKSDNAKIKVFALKMIDDHGKAALELGEIAQGRGFTIPLEMGAEHMKMLKKLQSLEGAAFDAYYVDLMVEEHDKTISLFVAASADEKLDSQLQKFAKNTLPVLREHLAHAKTLGAVTP